MVALDVTSVDSIMLPESRPVPWMTFSMRACTSGLRRSDTLATALCGT